MLPTGKMAPHVWKAQIELGLRILPLPFREVIEKIEQPFISACYTTPAIQVLFFDGHVLLLGDALSQFAPNAGQSTNQGARNALALKKVLHGEMTLAQWERESLSYAHVTRPASLSWGSGYLSSYPLWWFRVARQYIALALWRYWRLY